MTNTPIKLEPVPPPERTPTNQIGETLGLLPGLRPERQRGTSWRCSCCREWRKSGDWIVWVPDWTTLDMPLDVVQERIRANFYNGGSSGWCLSCAKQLGEQSIIAPEDVPVALLFGLPVAVLLAVLVALAIGGAP